MAAEVSVAVNTHQENPFQADGELSRKADYIISHSRISRTEVQIADPDSSRAQQPSFGEEDDDAVFIQPSDPIQAPKTEASISSCNTATENSKPKQKSEDTLGQQTVVETDVVKTEKKSKETPQKAEQIVLKSKKCCVVQ